MLYSNNPVCNTSNLTLTFSIIWKNNIANFIFYKICIWYIVRYNFISLFNFCTNFVNNDTKIATGVINFPKQDRKNTAVYEVLYVPYPTYLDMTYQITLRTEYAQQMNDLVTPFMTKTGGFNFFLLRKNGHQYESFIQSNFNLETNAASLNTEERIFTTKVEIKVLGYLLGEDKNEPQPKVVVRETAAKFEMQRERVITGDVNEYLEKEGFYRP